MMKEQISVFTMVSLQKHYILYFTECNKEAFGLIRFSLLIINLI